MKINKPIAFAVMLCVLLIGSVAAVVLYSRTGLNAALFLPQTNGAAEQSSSVNGASVDLDQGSITSDQAQAIAEAANPGAHALGAESDRVNINGWVSIYEVELDNETDVAVNRVNGKIVATKGRNSDWR